MSGQFEGFRRLVLERSGLVLATDKDYLLKSRLEPVARREGMGGLDQLLAAVGADPTGGLARRCIDAMATHESFFFRDGAPFEQIRDRLLPGLIEARAGARSLRIWSAACSSGQEPYSLAMLLREEAERLAGWRIDILATDMSTPILERARAGVYSDFEVRRGLSEARLARWFRPHAGGHQVIPEIRSMVRFAEHNLLSGAADLGRFDLILCRNVLIYFDRDRKREALAQIARVLEPHASLVMGSAETVVGLDSVFFPAEGLRGVFRPRTK